MPTYIVSVSGGLGSAEALRRTIEQKGKENTIAIFADVGGSGATHWWGLPQADTPNARRALATIYQGKPIIQELVHERMGGEDRSLYRFLHQLANHFKIPIERLEDERQRTIWTVMFAQRVITIFQYAPCSAQLKRERIKRWLEENVKGAYTMVLGLGWDERHRIKKAEAYWQCEVWCPLAERPFVDNCDLIKQFTAMGLDVPTSYGEGFPHSNCRGGCVRSGISSFHWLYQQRPEIFLYWLQQEEAFRRYLKRKVTILKDRRGGQARPMSLRKLMERIELGDLIMKDEWGGCGCFTNYQQPILDIVGQVSVAAPTLNRKQRLQQRMNELLAKQTL